MSKESRAKKVLPMIRGLEVGMSVSFPIEWIDTVRAQTSKCNLIMPGRRITSTNKEARIIEVKRIE